MTQPQPILHSAFQDDLAMAYSSSLNNPSGSFNPASYTRAFFGSPFSWRPGSFGNRTLPGSSPTQLLGPLDPTDLHGAGKISSSMESDRGSLINALSAMEREDELIPALNPTSSTPPPPPPIPSATPQQLQQHHHNQQPHQQLQLLQQQQFQQQRHLQQQSHQPQGLFDADDMELDDSSPASSSASSPPLTPVTTPLVPYTTQRAFNNASSYTPLSLSQPPSSCPSPVSAFDTTAVLPSRGASSSISPFPSPHHDSFNAYSTYSEYGALSPLQSTPDATGASSSQPGSPFSCVPPTLLYSPNSTTPANTPSSSRVASPVAAQGQASYHPLSAQASTSASASTTPSPTSTPRASTTLSRPASSLLLSKPFRCPKPNCNKSYKQANGLKYHMTHGSCNFAPPKDLEALQALLAEKGVVVNGNERSGVQITEGELREVEREAERRLRPFACGVGDCQRRYKNMNGL
ncbi:hypothetical protein EI94DRAFT_1706587, partial [Lactarius quietus]